jgi:predicted phosphodiesterase
MKILIVSDIHGNLAALQAVLEAEPDPDLTVCLGDLVDYGPQPAECIALIREKAQIIVQGNHDYAVGKHEDPHCSPAYAHLAQVTRDFSMAALDHDTAHLLAALPLHEEFHRMGERFSAFHAAPSSPLFQYLPPDAPPQTWETEVGLALDPDILLLGHTHLPLLKKIGVTTVLNPGSVGQPKDGDPRAAYAVWEDGKITLRRADYDVRRTADAFKDTALEPTDVARLVAILLSGGSDGP